MSSLSLVDAAGEVVPLRDGGWEVEEARTYSLRAPARVEARLEDRPLEWQQEASGFVLDLPHVVGRYRLEVVASGRTTVYPLVVRPASSKVSETEWEAMLADLDRWLPGLVAGAEGAGVGHVGLQGAPAPFAVTALLPLVQLFERALDAVLEQPRTLEIDRIEDVLLVHARRPTPEALTWLARHPDVAQWLDIEREDRLTGLPPRMPQRLLDQTRDHPANRYLRWLVEQVVRRFRAIASALDTVRGHDLTSTRAWADAKARSLREAATGLERRVRRSFLAGLRPQPATAAALLVVTDHPHYARVHRLGRRFLSPLFSLGGEGPAASTRPSFELYELWCFFATWQALDRAAGPDLKWHLVGERALFVGPSGGEVRLHTTWCGAPLVVHFNPTFTSSLNPRPRHGRWSITGERRPDITVGWAHPEHSAWIALDAKYRVGRSALADAFASVHIYRDSLRWEGRGGPCRAAALLAPRRTADCELWFTPRFFEDHGIGVHALRPGTSLPAYFGEWLLNLLAAPRETA